MYNQNSGPVRTRMSHYLRTGQKIGGFRPDSYKSYDLCDLCGGMVYDLDIKSIRSERNARYRALFGGYQAAKRAGKTHKIWQIAGGITTRQSHERANGQKVRIDEAFRVGGEALFLPNDPEASLSETANCRCSVKYVEETARNNLIKHYSLKSGVILPVAIEQWVSQIADEYYELSQQNIVVTSGTRTAYSQATAMYNNRARGILFTIYKNQIAAKEIEKAYNDGILANKKPFQIIKDMEKVISAQIARKIYVSKHLEAGAVDIQRKFMTTSKQKENFRKVARKYATVVILEGDHWHLQF